MQPRGLQAWDETLKGQQHHDTRGLGLQTTDQWHIAGHRRKATLGAGLVFWYMKRTIGDQWRSIAWSGWPETK